MTHANVYRYFPSKDALLDAVAGRWLRELETELADIADAPDPADDKIERFLGALATAQSEMLVREPHLFAVHLDAAVAALEAVGEWTTPAIEDALKVALIDGLELKPRKAFGPIRVAATGSSISPPLFESLELLGRDRSLTRLRAGRDHARAAG